MFLGPSFDGVTPRLTAAAWCAGMMMLNSTGLTGYAAVLL